MDLYFPEVYDPVQVRVTTTACWDCLIFKICRKWSDIARPSYGIWGGETEKERKRRYKNIDEKELQHGPSQAPERLRSARR